MFTGIVEETGTVQFIKTASTGTTVSIACTTVLQDIHLGDSIAVNGLCLTVTGYTTHSFTADVMPVTLEKSSLRRLHPGQMVNLERALQLSSRLGGHLVTGHIDGIGQITGIQHHQNAVLITIQPQPEQLSSMIPEGSVCINGISLTIAQLGNETFTVSLIPHTYHHTGMHHCKLGDEVNIETDVIGKYVQRFVQQPPQDAPLSRESLIKNGFI
jgi:riboflavin synthase